MILFNTTVSLDSSISAKWVDWVKAYYIPKAIDSGKVHKCKLCKIRGRDPMEITYSIQLIYGSELKMNGFKDEEGCKLNIEMDRLFAGKYVCFETVLDIVYSK